MENCKRTRIPIVTGSGKKRVLEIHSRQENASGFWEDISIRYWNGALPGLAVQPSSGTARVQAGRVCDHGTLFYFKRLFPRDRFDLIKQKFRRSRAFRDFSATRAAKKRGLGVPEVVCVIEERRWGLYLDSALITEEIKGAVQLRPLIAELNEKGNTQGRRTLLRLLGKEMARWHVSGMRHGDPIDTNIFCRIAGGSADFINMKPEPKNSPGGTATISRIDFFWLDNERSSPVCLKREFIRNLVHLNMIRGITITDRMRFWEAYWEHAGHIYGSRSRSAVLRQVVRKSRKRWKKRGWLQPL